MRNPMQYSEKLRKFTDNQSVLFTFTAAITVPIAEISYFKFIFCIVLIIGKFYEFF